MISIITWNLGVILDFPSPSPTRANPLPSSQLSQTCPKSDFFSISTALTKTRVPSFLIWLISERSSHFSFPPISTLDLPICNHHNHLYPQMWLLFPFSDSLNNWLPRALRIRAKIFNIAYKHYRIQPLPSSPHSTLTTHSLTTSHNDILSIPQNVLFSFSFC